MSTFVVTQTTAPQIRLLDTATPMSVERLRIILEHHMAPDQAERCLAPFCDPQLVSSTQATDWYTDHAGKAVPLADLPPEEQQALLEEVGAIRQDILGLADQLEESPSTVSDARFLRSAVQLPANEGYIFSVGGNPVLVGWGYRLTDTSRGPVAAGIWMPSTRPPAEETEAESDQAGADQGLLAGAMAPVVHTGSWLGWLLWLIFFLLLMAILWLVLNSCSIGFPNSALSQRLGLFNQCPAPRTVVLSRQAEADDRSDALRNAIREAELALAEDAQECRVVRIEEEEVRRQAVEEAEAAPPPPPPPPPEPEPEPEVSDDDMADLDERVRDAGGETGELQVILEWDGPADLDLYITCGNERIYYQRDSRTGCSGGTLDVDANHDVHMDRPVENVRWTQQPPPGVYGIEVDNFTDNGDPRGAVPYRVVVRRRDGSVQSFEGAVSEGPRDRVGQIRLD